MRDKPNEFLESRRVTKGPMRSTSKFGNNGLFIVLYAGREWTVIASNGLDWEHVSVANKKITPSWEVMCYFKNLFWNEDETVIQFHPAKEDYVNNHKHCLHMWKPLKEEIPTPFKLMVGV